MPKMIRTAKGQMINFDEIKIKNHLQSIEKPVTIDLDSNEQKQKKVRMRKVRRVVKQMVNKEGESK